MSASDRNAELNAAKIVLKEQVRIMRQQIIWREHSVIENYRLIRDATTLLDAIDIIENLQKVKG